MTDKDKMPDEIWAGEFYKNGASELTDGWNIHGHGTKYIRANHTPTIEPWNIDDHTFEPSKESVLSALAAFKNGKPVNCIQVAHLAKAAQCYITRSPTTPSIIPETADDIGALADIPDDKKVNDSEEKQRRLDLCRQRLKDVTRNVKYILPDLTKRANRAEDREQSKMSLHVGEVYNHMDAMAFIQNNSELLDKLLEQAGARIDLENLRTVGKA